MRVAEIVETEDKFYVYLNGDIVSIQTTLLKATKKLAAQVQGMS